MPASVWKAAASSRFCTRKQVMFTYAVGVNGQRAAWSFPKAPPECATITTASARSSRRRSDYTQVCETIEAKITALAVFVKAFADYRGPKEMGNRRPFPTLNTR
jgi:hypothetical protein